MIHVHVDRVSFVDHDGVGAGHCVPALEAPGQDLYPEQCLWLKPEDNPGLPWSDQLLDVHRILWGAAVQDQNGRQWFVSTLSGSGQDATLTELALHAEKYFPEYVYTRIRCEDDCGAKGTLVTRNGGADQCLVTRNGGADQCPLVGWNKPKPPPGISALPSLRQLQQEEWARLDWFGFPRHKAEIKW